MSLDSLNGLSLADAERGISSAASAAGTDATTTASTATQTKGSTASPQTNESDAVVVSLSNQSGALSVSNVEKHLNDVKNGVGYLSKQTANAIDQADTTTHSSLNAANATLYSAVLTGLTYNQRARFVQTLSHDTQALQIINPQQAKANTDAILKAFGEKIPPSKSGN